MSRHGAVGRRPAWASVGVAAILSAGAPAWSASLPEGGPQTPNPGAAVFAPEASNPSSPDVECLAQAVYYEAGGESRAGREAVAEVVLR